MKAVLESPEQTIGRTVSLETDTAPFSQIAALFGRVTGQTAIYCEVIDEGFEHLYGPLYGRELALGLRFHRCYPADGAYQRLDLALY